jgi:protein-S-isoprenylcysteine O-methyltransferase Ste14
VFNTAWLLVLLPVVLLYVHFVDIKREERQLAKQFGDEYHRYCAEVRRYL